MAIARKWDLVSLERALRKALLKRAKVRFKELPGASAHVEWTDPGPIKADVDRFSVSELAGVLHELMHPVLQDALAPFSEEPREMAEIAVEAWELALAERILANSRKKLWWRRAIKQKLGGR